MNATIECLHPLGGIQVEILKLHGLRSELFARKRRGNGPRASQQHRCRERPGPAVHMLDVRVHDGLLSQVGYPESSTVTLRIDGAPDPYGVLRMLRCLVRGRGARPTAT